MVYIWNSRVKLRFLVLLYLFSDSFSDAEEGALEFPSNLPEIEIPTAEYGSKDSAKINNEHLKTTSDILVTISDTEAAGWLDNKMQKHIWKRLGKLADALKGISVLAGILSMALPQDDDTQIIIDEIQKGFKSMEDKMNNQTNQLMSYMDQLDINNNVIIPLNTQFKAMKAYAKYPDNSTFEGLERHFASNPPLQIAGFILHNAGKKLENNYKATDYDMAMFDTLCNTFRERFLQAYMIYIFRSRLKYQKVVGGEKEAMERFERDGAELERIIEKQRELFFGTYLESTRKIVRRILDENPSQTNNNLAVLIRDEIFKKFYWGHYSVLVYEATSGYENHAFLPFANSSMFEFRYQGHCVVVLLASKNFQERAKRFRAIPQSKVENILAASYNPQNISSVLYALENELDYEAQWGAVKLSFR